MPYGEERPGRRGGADLVLVDPATRARTLLTDSPQGCRRPLATARTPYHWLALAAAPTDQYRERARSGGGLLLFAQCDSPRLTSAGSQRPTLAASR